VAPVCRKHLDQLAAEGRDVVGFAAGDQIIIDHRFVEADKARGRRMTS